jgi:ribosomal-protein-alanine N-acetyltransferase
MALSDIKSVISIEKQCHSHPWPEKLFLSHFGMRYFNHILQIDNKTIGYFIASHVAGEVTLMNIAIDPNFQGQGFGFQLINELIHKSKQQDQIEIWLEVRESNQNAIKLYQKMGFVEVDKRKNYYPIANSKTQREDAIIMCCYL